MPFAFAVVCEAAADFRTATGLAERVIRDRVDWVEEEAFLHCPVWRGAIDAASFVLWTDIPKLAKELGIRSHGHFGDRPAEPDAHAARRAILVLKQKHAEMPLDGILLIRDDDRDTRRRIGLEQAREAEKALRDRIVIGLAHCKRECWVLAGFDPMYPEEVARLAEVREDLGFDPRFASHQLTAKHDPDKRSAKRVLGVLTGDKLDREAACWEKCSLDSLRDRGGESGLKAFLEEVQLRLVPLFHRGPSG